MPGSSMTFAYDNGLDISGQHGGVKKLTVTWLSDDTTGAVSGTSARISGRLIKAVTDPGAAAPTASYDIAITDEQGVSVLAACDDDLADRHTSNTEEVYFFLKDHAAGTPLAQSLHPVVCNALTFAVTAAGNAKNGVIYLYYAPHGV